MSDSKYVIAFDLGTSSMKAIIMDNKGKVIADGKRELHPVFPQNNWAESDPVAWWDAACDISKSMMKEKNISKDDVVSIGFDAPSAGFVCVSKEKGLLHPSIIWLDKRSGAEADEINETIGRLIGDPNCKAFDASDNIPKALWFQRNKPEIWAETNAILSDTGYMVYRATDALTMSYQDVISLAYDFENKDWAYNQLALANIPNEKLPKIMNSGDIAGYVTEKAAKELGVNPGLPVTAGFSDCSAVELGLNSTEPGDASLYIGTSMLFGLINDDDRGNEVTAYNFPSTHPDHKMYLCTNDYSGGCIDWILNRLFDPANNKKSMEECYAEMDKLIDETPAGSNNLFFSTYFAGERQPICDHFVRAGYWNLNPNHSRGDMVRAVYEGIGYEIRWTLSEFEKTHGYHFDRLPVAGGGAKSERLMQIVADITGITLDVLEDPGFCIAKATGFQSFIAAGTMTFDDVRALRTVKKTFIPNKANKDVYDNGMKTYVDYYELTKDFFAKLNK